MTSFFQPKWCSGSSILIQLTPPSSERKVPSVRGRRAVNVDCRSLLPGRRHAEPDVRFLHPLELDEGDSRVRAVVHILPRRHPDVEASSQIAFLMRSSLTSTMSLLFIGIENSIVPSEPLRIALSVSGRSRVNSFRCATWATVNSLGEPISR